MAKIKIPANVSPIRRALAEAAARKKLGTPVVKKPENPASNVIRAKAGQEAADARKKAREAMQSAAEKDLRVKELEEKLATAQRELEEKAPLAEKWTKHDHVRRERLIAKFPTEERKKVGKLDADALEMLAEARGFMGDGAAAGNGQAGAKTGAPILSLEDANRAAKENPKAYNEWVDKVAAGTIKLNADGKVIA